MNKSYKNIWNAALGTWVAVSEITRACGKRSSPTLAAGTASLLFGIALASPMPVDAANLVYNPGAGATQVESGNLSGANALVKQGAGTLQLTGNNTYTGNTTVSAGQLLLSDGGQITSTASTVIGGNGTTATVTGTSTVLSTGALQMTGVAGSGSATLNITDGGLLQATGSALIGGPLMRDAATVNVSGAGSALDVSGIINMGSSNDAQSKSVVNVTAGGHISSSGLTVGNPLAVTLDPVVVVSGAGSAWAVQNLLTFNKGSMSILDGGTMTVGSGVMRGVASASARLLVSGIGSSLVSAGTFNIGNSNSTAIVTLTDGGRLVAGNTVTLASNALATGTLNIGGADGAAPARAGTLDTATLAFGPGTGTLNFNHTDTAYVFAPVISGIGTINQNGPGLTRLTANSGGFTGTTNVNAGTLSVNGILGGTMNVNGGRLQGTGQVGDTTNFAGGTIAPGNSIGTLLIAGNYTGSGGVLEMEGVLAGTGSPADRLLITGNATGSTQVHVINTGGAGAVTGAGNTDGISIIQVGGASTASTFQLAGGYAAAGPFQYTLKAFDKASSAAGEVDPLLGAVPFNDYRLQSLVDASGKPVAVPQIAGYQAMPTGAVRYGASLLDSVHKRLGEIRETAALENQNGSSERDGERSKEVFLRTQGSSSDVSGNRASGYDQDIWYVQAGGNVFGRDMADGATLRIGGALSVGGSKLNADESSAKVDLDATTLALTTTYQSAAGWYLDSVAQGTRYSSEITTSQRGKTGDPKGWGWGLSLEGGYPFDMGNGLILEPQAQLSYQRIRFDTFTDIDRIDVDLNDGESLRGRFGGRILRTFADGTGREWSPFVEANLIHEFLSAGRITASGIGFDSDSSGTSVQFGGGLNAKIRPNTALYASLSYEKGVSSAAADSWGGNLGVRIDF